MKRSSVTLLSLLVLRVVEGSVSASNETTIDARVSKMIDRLSLLLQNRCNAGYFRRQPLFHPYSPFYDYRANYVDFRRNLFPFSNRIVDPFLKKTILLEHLLLKKLLLIPGFKEGINLYDLCSASSGSEFGICLGRKQCLLETGQIGSSCGVATFCCFDMKKSRCGNEITLNNTYWTSPSSLTGLNECTSTVKIDSSIYKDGNSVCQIRLDFVNFDLAQPTGSGNTCSDDNQFQVVSGTRNSVPAICGSNSGQHMYLHTSGSDIKLKFKLNGKDGLGWKIKVSYIPCSSSWLAPYDCLQYFTGPSGNFNSFYSQSVSLYRRSRLKQESVTKKEPDDAMENDDIGEMLRREFEAMEVEATTIDPVVTTTRKPTAPIDGGGYVYRVVNIGGQDVKICFKKTH